MLSLTDLLTRSGVHPTFIAGTQNNPVETFETVIDGKTYTHASSDDQIDFQTGYDWAMHGATCGGLNRAEMAGWEVGYEQKLARDREEAKVDAHRAAWADRYGY